MKTKEEKMMIATSVAMALGSVAGLSYAFFKKKHFCGYVGFGLLGGFVFSSLTYAGSMIIIKDEYK